MRRGVGYKTGERDGSVPMKADAGFSRPSSIVIVLVKEAVDRSPMRSGGYNSVMSCLVGRDRRSFLKAPRPLHACSFRATSRRRSCAIAWSASPSAGTCLSCSTCRYSCDVQGLLQRISRLHIGSRTHQSALNESICISAMTTSKFERRGVAFPISRARRTLDSFPNNEEPIERMRLSSRPYGGPHHATYILADVGRVVGGRLHVQSIGKFSARVRPSRPGFPLNTLVFFCTEAQVLGCDRPHRTIVGFAVGRSYDDSVHIPAAAGELVHTLARHTVACPCGNSYSYSETVVHRAQSGADARSNHRTAANASTKPQIQAQSCKSRPSTSRNDARNCRPQK
eukprot:563637-Prorocentrum_minimum.AAC.1